MRISDWSSDVCSSDLYATVVTAPDSLLPKQREDILEARAVSYFMHREVGLPIVSMNGWDEAPMDRLVETGLSRLEYGQGDIAAARRQMARSEEHTSELQSLMRISYAVFCFKKKKKQNIE